MVADLGAGHLTDEGHLLLLFMCLILPAGIEEDHLITIGEEAVVGLPEDDRLRSVHLLQKNLLKSEWSCFITS